MTVYTENFDLADGTVLTNANTFWTATNGSWVADTSRFAGGTASAKCNRVAGASSTCIKSGLTSSALAFRGFYYFTAASAQDNGLVQIYDGANKVVDLYWISNSNIRLADDAGVRWTSSGAMPLNQQVRVEVYATAAVSSATLTVEISVGDSSTPLYSFSTTTANTGTGFTEIRSGIGTSVYAAAYWMDEFTIDTAASGLLGPPALVVGTKPLVYTFQGGDPNSWANWE